MSTLAVGVLLLLASAASAQDACPVSYSGYQGSLLFGALNTAECRLSSGEQCPARNTKW